MKSFFAVSLLVVLSSMAGAVVSRPFERACDRFEASRNEYLSRGDRKPGNEPYLLITPGSACGQPAAHSAVIIHGMGDSPMTLRPIGEELHRRGVNVVGVRLTGYGTTNPEDALTFGVGSRWERDVREGLVTAAGLGENVTIVGYSAGGVLGLKSLVDGTLAQSYAGRVAQSRVRNVVLLAPALGVADRTARSYCPHSPFTVWYYQLTKTPQAPKPENLPERHANDASPWTVCQLQEVIDRYGTGRADRIEAIRAKNIRVFVVSSTADAQVDATEIRSFVDALGSHAQTRTVEGVSHGQVHAIPDLPQRISEFVLQP